jgi:hypothetical protein
MVVTDAAAVGCDGTTSPCTAARNGGGGDKVSYCIHKPATLPTLTQTEQVTAIFAVASFVNVERLQLGAATTTHETCSDGCASCMGDHIAYLIHLPPSSVQQQRASAATPAQATKRSGPHTSQAAHRRARQRLWCSSALGWRDV